VALKEVVGVSKGTVTLDDFERAEAIVVIGQNPGTNHPRMLTSLEQAKRNGAAIISINPLPEAGLIRFKQPQDLKNPVGLAKALFGSGTTISDLFLPVRINGDVAVLKGIAKALLEAEDRDPGTELDHRFIGDRTAGFEAFAADIRGESWDVIVAEGGVERTLIRQAAEVLRRSERIIFCWAMGLTQHRNAVGNIQMVVNLALMRGAVGKPGAGLCPVRGHSNVQGDRTVGITPRPAPAFLDRLAEACAFDPPRTPGLDTVDAIRAMHEGRATVFFSMGGNFLSATPDTEYTAEALRRCSLTVQVSTKLNRAHLVTGREALILPCLGRTEVDEQAGGKQFVTMENSMGIVHASGFDDDHVINK
jgi:molybdopterin-dependent oxidoreductase alpha subunit